MQIKQKKVETERREEGNRDRSDIESERNWKKNWERY